jgi:hypothetical protein
LIFFRNLGDFSSASPVLQLQLLDRQVHTRWWATAGGDDAIRNRSTLALLLGIPDGQVQGIVSYGLHLVGS